GSDGAELQAAPPRLPQEHPWLHTRLQLGAPPAFPAEPGLSSEEEEEAVGMEDVKSHTYSRPLRPSGTSTEASPQPRPGARVWGVPGSGLQLEAKLPTEEPGIIVTNQDLLTQAQGIQLLGALAQLLELPEGTFSSIQVEGPAVTFRVSPLGTLNVTAAGLAQAAGRDSSPCEDKAVPVQAGLGASAMAVGNWHSFLGSP
ncbi:receptor-type tyrosine-protein phosphatase N2-like, partial [Erinaceus europaeus]|uniref:Receptor-type tyrosine-protein phosphatase N2-like n=1 Tax=Erinaceus europaeus TaxID=9365 RepID=A0ABM3WTK8_ERIEU